MHCLQVLLDVARSLAYIHSMSLLHCDLKPVNVSKQSTAGSYPCMHAGFDFS